MASAGAEADGRRPHGPTWRWRGTGLALSSIAIVGGLGLRFVAPSPLWLDEALSVNIAELGFGDMVDALRHDGHPALWYLLLGWWIDLFGAGDTAVRALAGIFSLLTVPVVWCLARRWDPPTAGIAALLALTSPFLLRYGTEARMYSLLVFLVAVGWLAVGRALDEPSLGRLVSVALVAAALVHTHYWTFWVLAAAVSMLGWYARREPGRRHEAVRVGGAVILGAATILVWVDVFFDQLTATGTPWASRARPAEVAIEVVQGLGGSKRFEGELLGMLLVGLALLGTLAVGAARDTLELRIRPTGHAVVPAAMVALTLTIGTLAALVTSGAFEARYTAVVVPFVLVLAARGVTVLPGAAAPVAAVGMVLFGLSVGIDEARRDRTQGAEVAAAIDATAGPDDVVVLCPDQLGPAATRTLDHGGIRVAYPSGTGDLVDWSDYLDRISETDPIRFAESVHALAGTADVWMVTGTTYRGFDGRCETIVATLRSFRAGAPVVGARTVFEPMALLRFEAAR